MRRAFLLFLTLVVSACTVGPDYRRPEVATPSRYKELEGWILAAPNLAEAPKGAWWRIYGDDVLDALERRLDLDNQTIKEYEARYRASVAMVAQARAGYFPTVSANAGATRDASSAGSTGLHSVKTQYSLQGSADWSPDLWGRIRREVESAQAAAQVSAADLANARLSAEAMLAADYFDLRAEDALIALLQETVAAYTEALRITENRYRAGTASDADVAAAQAQLESTKAQLVGVGAQRALYEHAIAALIGSTPAEFSLTPVPLTDHVPVVPPGIPSTLLQRRPDIAAAERAVQQQNALIGQAEAAYFPEVSLSALVGFVGSPLGTLIRTANRVWSLGAAADETLFDGGLRSAQVDQARANYDEAVATYRQTVLTAFQQVEDQLATLRIYEQQAKVQEAAVRATARAVEVTMNAYRAGTVPYTSAITEQALLLADQQSALAIQQSRLVASVALIQALGGGWQQEGEKMD